MIKRSFCTTSYNTGRRLYYFLHSIVPFMTNEDELICIDNNSDEETRYIYEQFLKLYPNKNIWILFQRCNRGEGFDMAHRLATGRYHITLGADVIYNRNFWKIVNIWTKQKESKFVVLTMNGSWIFPYWLYWAEGGYKHVNGSEDTNFRNRLIPKNLWRYCPIVIGENTDPSVNPEKRYAKSKLHILWRTILAEKDHIRMVDTMDLKDRLEKAYDFTHHGVFFYIFWFPLLSYLSIYRLFKNKQELPDLSQFIVDFKIRGKRYEI